MVLYSKWFIDKAPQSALCATQTQRHTLYDELCATNHLQSLWHDPMDRWQICNKVGTKFGILLSLHVPHPFIYKPPSFDTKHPRKKEVPCSCSLRFVWWWFWVDKALLPKGKLTSVNNHFAKPNHSIIMSPPALKRIIRSAQKIISKKGNTCCLLSRYLLITLSRVGFFC